MNESWHVKRREQLPTCERPGAPLPSKPISDPQNHPKFSPRSTAPQKKIPRTSPRPTTPATTRVRARNLFLPPPISHPPFRKPRSKMAAATRGLRPLLGPLRPVVARAPRMPGLAARAQSTIRDQIRESNKRSYKEMKRGDVKAPSPSADMAAQTDMMRNRMLLPGTLSQTPQTASSRGKEVKQKTPWRHNCHPE